MLTAVWIALAVGFAAFAGGAAFAVSRAFRAYRTFRRTSRTITRHLGDLTAKAAATEEKAVAATGNSTKLADAATKLQESLAVLAVLRAAFSETTAGVGRVRGAVPRK
jgi:uracil phosphoribosyltransferase